MSAYKVLSDKDCGYIDSSLQSCFVDLSGENPSGGDIILVENTDVKSQVQVFSLDISSDVAVDVVLKSDSNKIASLNLNTTGGLSVQSSCKEIPKFVTKLGGSLLLQLLGSLSSATNVGVHILYRIRKQK
jgi:hypothetical protein